MPDFPAPVASQIKPPDPQAGIQTLSGFLGLRQQRQNLQTGQYQQEIAQAQSQQEQQTTRQRQAAAQFFQNYDVASHVGPDGTIDLDQALTNPQLKATGDAYPVIASNLIDIKNKQLQAKTGLANLTDNLRQQFYKNVGGLSTDSDVKAGNATGIGKTLDAIDQFGQSGGPDAVRVAATYKPIIQALQQSGKTEKLPEVLRNFQLQAQDASSQTNLTRGTPGTMDTGGGLQPGVQDAFTGAFTPAGKPIPKQLGPEARAESVDLGNGQRAILNRATGQYELVQPGPGQSSQTRNAPPGLAGTNSSPPQPFGRDAQGRVLTAADAAPPANAPRADQENYRVAAAAARDHVSTVRDQDQGYGTNMAVASEIRRLSGSTTTGPGTTAFNQWAGTLGTRVGVDISDYQKLGAFLDRQSADLRKQMGLPGTNAGQETAAAISGNTEYQRKAIQAKNDYNEALTQGLHDYRQGLDRVESFTGDANPREVQRYRAAWTSNFDPRAYEYKLAKQRGDADAANSFLANLSPQQAKATAQKLRNLDKLTQGQAP